MEDELKRKSIEKEDIKTYEEKECLRFSFNCRHGGPGAGVGPCDHRFFDLEVYRVILFDQRGAGKSTPAGELKVKRA